MGGVIAIGWYKPDGERLWSRNNNHLTSIARKSFCKQSVIARKANIPFSYELPLYSFAVRRAASRERKIDLILTITAGSA